MMDLDCVASFLAVVSSGSFRSAARRMGLSQPAVTQHVKKLEKALNVTLIRRGLPHCTLTAEGCEFLPYAENLLRTSERARALFQRRGIIVGASSNIGVYFLPSFLKASRDVLDFELELVIDDNPGIARKLQDLSIDVAVMEWWDGRPGFIAQRWKQERLVMIVPPGHPWWNLPSVPRTALGEQPLLGGEAGTGTGRLLKQYLGEQADNMRIGMQLGSTEAVKRAVRAGLGVSLVMESTVADETKAGLLRAIPISDVTLQKDIYLVRRLAARPDDMTARFIGYMQENRDVVPAQFLQKGVDFQ